MGMSLSITSVRSPKELPAIVDRFIAKFADAASLPKAWINELCVSVQKISAGGERSVNNIDYGRIIAVYFFLSSLSGKFLSQESCKVL